MYLNPKTILPVCFFSLFFFTIFDCGLLNDFPFSPKNVVGDAVYRQCFSSLTYAQDIDLSILDSENEPSHLEQVSQSTKIEKEKQKNKENLRTSVPSPEGRMLELIMAGGWIGTILLICSLFAVSLIIRLCLSLRRSTIIPEALVDALKANITHGAYDIALQKASVSNSFLGRIATAGLKENARGWDAIEKALEDAGNEQTSRFYRRTEPLSMIGNVAPMLGLLGTVIGMVTTFGELAVADTGGRNLAHGIYFALVTTVDGLIVAIPLLVAHSLLNARIAKLASETLEILESIFEPVKHRQYLTVSTLEKKIPGLHEISAKTPSVQQDTSEKSQIFNNSPSVTLPNSKVETTFHRQSLSLKNRQ